MALSLLGFALSYIWVLIVVSIYVCPRTRVIGPSSRSRRALAGWRHGLAFGMHLDLHCLLSCWWWTDSVNDALDYNCGRCCPC